MPAGRLTHAIVRAAGRVPGLKRVPLMTLIAIGEIALLAHDHLSRLTPQERRRLMHLLRIAKGRPSHLRPDERNELAALVAKAEPRLFMSAVADRFSPVPGTGRFVRGRSKN